MSVLLEGGGDGAHGCRERGGVDAEAADEAVEPVPERCAGGGQGSAALPGQGEAAAVARPAGDLDVTVAGQAGDHPRHRGLARPEPTGEVALGHPLVLRDVEEDEEAGEG